MIKLHMMGGQTIEVTDNKMTVALAFNSNKKFKSFTELMPYIIKNEERNTRNILVNLNNVLYVSHE